MLCPLQSSTTTLCPFTVNFLNMWCLLFTVLSATSKLPRVGVGTHMCLHPRAYGMFVRVSARCGGVHVSTCVRFCTCFCSGGCPPSCRPLCLDGPLPCLLSLVSSFRCASPELHPQPSSRSAFPLWAASPAVWVTAWLMCPGGLSPVGQVCPEARGALLCRRCLTVPPGRGLVGRQGPLVPALHLCPLSSAVNSVSLLFSRAQAPCLAQLLASLLK